MMHVPEILAASVLAVLGFLLALGIKRLLSGQDTMVQNQANMTVQLTRTCEQLAASRQWQEQHDKTDDERHEKNNAEHLRIEADIDKKYDRHEEVHENMWSAMNKLKP